MRNNQILDEDLQNIHGRLSDREKDKLAGSTIVLTGCGGFLGYYFMHFLSTFSETLNLKRIVGLDNFLTGTSDWLNQLVDSNPKIELHHFDITVDNLAQVKNAEGADYVIHMASIASPTFYRQYPLETLDANVTGLRRLFDFYKDKSIDGFLFFSSSEIYGDPFPEFIPTSEEYCGNVKTMGPRACYDEAKRFGETMCWVFAHHYDFPVTIARPFNNFGPGMNIADKRLPADFAHAIIENKDLHILSDGKPTRTFCYIVDAISGYFKVMLYEKLEAFNIGNDRPEISVADFADLFIKHGQRIFGYKGKIRFKTSDDKDYTTDNPNRRCPSIEKARIMLNYNPTIHVEEGIIRYLDFLKLFDGKLI